MASAGREFFDKLRARWIRENGSVGTSTISGNELPNLLDTDLVTIVAFCFSFTVQDLSVLSTGARSIEEDRVVRYDANPVTIDRVERTVPGFSEEGRSSFRWSRASLIQWLQMERVEGQPLARMHRDPAGKWHTFYLWRDYNPNVPTRAMPKADRDRAARVLVEWNALKKGVDWAQSNQVLPQYRAGKPPGSIRLSRDNVQVVWSPMFRLLDLLKSPAVAVNDDPTFNRVINAVESAVKTAGGAVKDAAEAIGDISAEDVKNAIRDAARAAGEAAGEVADIAGEASGRFGAGFLKNVGLYGAGLIVGLLLLKKAKIL